MVCKTGSAAKVGSSNSTKGQAEEMIFDIISSFHIPSLYTSRKQCEFLLFSFSKAQVEQDLLKSKLQGIQYTSFSKPEISYPTSPEESQTLILPLLYFVWPNDVFLQPTVD